MPQIPSARNVPEAQLGQAGVPRIPTLASDGVDIKSALDIAKYFATNEGKLEKERQAVHVEKALTNTASAFDAADAEMRTTSGSRAEIGDALAARQASIVAETAKTLGNEHMRNEFLRRAEPLQRAYLAHGLAYAEAAGFEHTENTVRSTLGAFGNAIMRDPASAAIYEKQGINSIAQGASTLPVRRREKLIKDWAAGVPEFALRGLVDNDPEEALRVLDRGRLPGEGGLSFDKVLPPEKQDALRASANVQIRARVALENQRRIEQDRAEEKAREVVRNKFTTGILSPTEQNPLPTPTAIAADKTLKATDKEHLITLMERRAAGEEKKSQAATMENIVQNLVGGVLTVDDVRNSNLPATGEGSKEHFIGILRTMERQGETLAQRKVKADQQGTMENMVQKLAAGTLTSDDITKSNLPPTGEGSKEHFLGVLRARQAAANRDETSYGPAYQSVWSRVHLAEDDPTRLSDERHLNNMLITPENPNGLTTAGVLQLRSEIEGRRTLAGKGESDIKAATLKGVERLISAANPFIGRSDSRGDYLYSQFLIAFDQEYRRERAAGKSAVSLLADDSPGNIVKQLLPKYMRSNEQKMRDLFSDNEALMGRAPAAAPATPGPASKIPSQATRRAKDKAGTAVYEVGGKWLYENGLEYVP